MNVRNRKGSTLIITYLVISVLFVAGAAYMIRTVAEARLAERYKLTAQAFSIAEAGLENALYRLRMDFENDTTPSFRDADIDGITPCGPDDNNFYAFLPTTTVMNDVYSGTYTVQLRNVAGETDNVWVRSTGVVGDISKTLEAYMKMKDEAPWNNVIFGGVGAAGSVINGNVDIKGSVHLLGDGLTPADLAVDLGGGASVGNNYDSMPVELLNRVPPCPQRLHNGEMVESLDAEVRVKHGKAGLSGGSQIGFDNVAGDADKETMDGVYVSDGYGGNQGANNVYSDNGKYNNYDLGDEITFLQLSDPYEAYPTYQAYLKDKALVISDPAELAELANITPNSNFNYADADGSISMDGAGNMVVSGIVYIDGGDLNMSKAGNDKIINYTGQGSILVTGNAEISVNLYTQGNNSFPNNIMGIMTPNQINFTTSSIDVMGLFYAEDRITSTKQTKVAGAFIGNFFDMGGQAPKLYQVPAVVDNLPPGMINRGPIWVNDVILWRKIN